jgi:glyoxylase-like metal-dependent hydrolase (beta-lactamase superfamily II)
LSTYVPSSKAWAEEGPEEVAEELFRIPLPLPNDALRAVNAYLWRGDDGDLLIDCGWDDPLSWDVLTASLARFGSSLESIRQVFATHVHGDHLGAAGQIRKAGGALVTLGLGDRETALIQANDPAVSRSRTRELLLRHGADALVAALDQEQADHPRISRPAPLPDLFVSGGELLFQGRELELLPTPGHTRGHLCLWDGQDRLLFAGDHVLPHITPSIGVEVPTEHLPLLDFLRSLQLVRDLPAQLVLPAHGPSFQDLRGRVEELLRHHEERLLLCLEAVSLGARSATEVARSLPWTRRERRFDDLDNFNQLLAVNETAAHLDLLAERGELLREVSDLRVMFKVPPDQQRRQEP